MYLGIDLGTSGVKAMLIDAGQRVVGSATGREVATARPHPGWSEQDPADWIRATEEAVAGLRAAHPAEFSAVRGISKLAASAGSANHRRVNMKMSSPGAEVSV